MTFQAPLSWPEGWSRSQPIGKMGSAHQFKSNMERTTNRLYKELSLLRAESVVVSSNIAITMRGTPRADTARMKLADPGVALYFIRKERRYVMARDAYDNVLDNLHSLVLAIEGFRQMERHGGGTMMERAFEGFAALPDQSDWRAVLGFKRDDTVTLAVAEARYREGAKRVHTDTGGNHDAMIKLNTAIGHARQELRQ